MKFTLLTAVALFAVPAFAQEMFINKPVLTQCKKATSSWSPGTGPYNIIVVAAKDACGEPLQIIGDTPNTVIDWTVNIPAGTVVQISVADSADNEAWTDDITVGPSDDASCLKSAASSSASSSAPASPTAALTGGSSSSDSSTLKTTSSDDTSDSDSGLTPLGAANAGTNSLFNSATSARLASTPIMALSAIAALAVLAL